jgi:hypothetical protein
MTELALCSEQGSENESLNTSNQEIYVNSKRHDVAV